MWYDPAGRHGRGAHPTRAPCMTQWLCSGCGQCHTHTQTRTRTKVPSCQVLPLLRPTSSTNNPSYQLQPLRRNLESSRPIYQRGGTQAASGWSLLINNLQRGSWVLGCRSAFTSYSRGSPSFLNRRASSWVTHWVTTSLCSSDTTCHLSILEH